MGHLFRCVRISKELKKNYNIIFLSDLDENSENFLRQEDIPYIKLNGTISGEVKRDILINQFSQPNPILFVDVRGKKRELLVFAKNFGVKTIVYEDFSEEEINPTILINPNEYLKSAYKKNTVRYFFGEKYRILDSNIYRYSKNKFSNNINRLFICFGGADPRNFSMKVIPFLKKNCNHLIVDMALGPAYKNSFEIDSQIRELGNVNIYQGISFLAPLMAKTDAAITSGGTLMYECISLRLPVFCVATSDQEALEIRNCMARGLVGRSDGLVDNFLEENFESQLNEFVTNSCLRGEIFNAQKNILMFDGVQNIADICTNMRNEKFIS